MNGTPRLRSAFPQTPQTLQRTREYNITPTRPKPRDVGLRRSPVKVPQTKADAPLVPTGVIDAPSQRLYVVAFYIALNAWRVYESWTASDELDSTWLFLKWTSIDGVFLFGLQALRIPWLEWAFPTTLAIFLIHVVGNMFLMFQIPVRTLPCRAMVDLLTPRRFHSAVLNPDQIPFCLDSQRSTVNLPIRVNQTDPVLIELLRLDLSTGENETITISSKQLKQMKRQAGKKLSSSDAPEHRDILYPIRRTGIYRLQRVVDESNLEVRMRSSDALVVSCPRALIKNSHTHKCKGELSNLVLEVEGTPPLKIKYSRQVNKLDRGFSFQNIQPDHLRSPLLGQRSSGILFDAEQPEITWAQSQTIEVPLNESLNVGGEWFYNIEEVHDGCGNIANYSTLLDEADRFSPKSLPHWHQFSVHERPRLSLSGCDDQHFIEVAKGEHVNLPLRFHPVGQGYDYDGPFSLGYSFRGNELDERDSSDKVRQLSLKDLDQKPQIKESGWYMLNSISSQFCSGEILEPSSCYLHNPPEPELALKYEKIFDKCANNSVGLLLDLDLTGSPPFRLRYSIEHSKGVETKSLTVDGLRTQLDFTPSEAGFYRYRFLDIADTVYAPRSLKDKVPVLEQDVKPPASAHFLGSREVRRACFGEPVSIDVSFLGESPWTLHYELAHNGKKSKHVLESHAEIATIVTERLVSGGEYNLVLTSVKDRSNCKRTLKDSIRIDARSKPPHVSFGQIDKKRTVSALQGAKVDIPLRLSGERPWTVNYRNLDDDSPAIEKTFWQENSVLSVTQEGHYNLIGVTDSSCPGSVDQAARDFEVSWIPRPHIAAVDGSPVVIGSPIEKRDVCQGEDDSVELRLTGNPPYTIQCEQQRKMGRGTSSIRTRSLKTALHVTSMEMDTSEAGLYTYKFKEVGDSLYDYDPRSEPVLVTQRVNPLPSARFNSPGHIYGFCKEDVSGEESIPVTLEGVAPFFLEIIIKHHSNAKPEVVSIPNISSNRYNLPIPRRYLNLGQHVVSIHKVRDARGCQRTFENDASTVRVAVSDVPTIIPLESKIDYCVGERLSFSLSGHAPFDVFYTFDGVSRKATSRTTNFRRIAERPGIFTITAFEFWGTPPFEFTYIRSSIPRKGKKSEVLDIKHDISYEHRKTIKTSDEGTYEVVAIKDKFCSFSSQAQVEKPQKLLAGA
ncbi:nuclear envelope pore membrane protein, putative [Aspergillus fumigatus Z5]|nr:nuclear envelope pore membrane protein, putative [Aspergillus fumigatus Z5]